MLIDFVAQELRGIFCIIIDRDSEKVLQYTESEFPWSYSIYLDQN